MTTRTFADEIVETSQTIGTGTYDLDGAKGSYRAFSQGYANADTPYYVVRNKDGSKWEHNRLGVLTLGTPDRLSRNVILSTNGNAAVSWTTDDLPLTVYVPRTAEIDEAVLSGFRSPTRSPLLRSGGRWTDSDVDVAFYYDGASDFETGRYLSADAMFMQSPRRPFTAVGAANKIVSVNDIGRRFTLNNAAADRTVTLPALSSAGKGFVFEALGTSPAHNIILALDAGDTTVPIDYGTPGASRTITGGRWVMIWSDGTQWRTDYLVLPSRGHLRGLTLSAAGGTGTFGVAAGQAADDVGFDIMALGSAYTKTTGAWAVGTGNGSLDTGAIANNTWYHAFAIKRPDTSVVDFLTSLSPTAPTMPANYTLKRRIGAMKTDGSAQWIAFVQNGDEFQWKTIPTLDVNATDPGTAAVLRTMTVPSGIIVQAMMNVNIAIGVQGSGVFISDPAVNDQAPSLSASPGVQLVNVTANSSVWSPVTCRTDTSARVRTRLTATDGSTGLRMNTAGWIDRRDRDL